MLGGAISYNSIQTLLSAPHYSHLAPILVKSQGSGFSDPSRSP